MAGMPSSPSQRSRAVIGLLTTLCPHCEQAHDREAEEVGTCLKESATASPHSEGRNEA